MRPADLRNLSALVVVAAVVILAAWLQRGRGEVVPAPVPAATIPAATIPAALPRLLDLGSDKCIPCQKMAPILEELKVEWRGRASVEFIDVRQHPEASKTYGIRVIPTQILFDRDGKEVYRHEGFLAKAAIVEQLEAVAADR